MMHLSVNGLEFIKGWEKFYPKAYKDQAGIWTIGYGTIRYHDGRKVKEGDKIILAAAIMELDLECSGICKKMNIFLKQPLHQWQFDAFVSLAYNIGMPGFHTSTLLRKFNQDKPIIADYFLRWHKITKDGKLVASRGLLRRRRTEWNLFNKADYTGNSK